MILFNYIIYNELDPSDHDKMLKNLMKYHDVFDVDFDYLIDDYLSNCIFIGIMSESFKNTIGDEASSKNVAKAKELAVNYVTKEFSKYGKMIDVPTSIGFSDDDKNYYDSVKNLFMSNKELFDDIDFYVFDTSNPELEGGKKRKIMILKNYKGFVNESNKGFDFQNLFLQLTEYTVPAGYEETLEPILRKYVPNLQKDSIGNYFVEVGDSKTLFTSHLDTFSKTRKKINHVIEGSMIKTDGETVLGGDNKNGVVILLYMITKGVPGTYFFFIGEESIVNGVGCYGSTNALLQNPEYFFKFDKAIAFDRRGKGSFVKRQAGRYCASDEFADAVIEEFGKNGLEFGKDNAYRTDSAIFMDTISEITNLSSGGVYEHTYMEGTDIQYVEEVSIAATKIDWDNLPIVRVPEKLPSEVEEEMEITEELTKDSNSTFLKVTKLMGAKGFICLNKDDFQPGVIMIYNKFLEDKLVKLVFKGKEIRCLEGHGKIGKFRTGDFGEFKRRQKLRIKNLSRGIWLESSKQMDVDGILSNDKFIELLDSYDITYDEFKEYMNETDEKQFLEFKEDHIELDMKILHQGLKKKQEDQERILGDKVTEEEKQKEIEEALKILKGYKVVDINKTRMLKFINNNDDIERYFIIKRFNKDGSFDGWMSFDNIKDLSIINPEILYDRKLDVTYGR